MAGWDGNGNVTTTYDWTDDAANGINIEAARVEQNEDDLISAIESTLNRDGENAMAADLAMGTNKITGLGDGTAATDGVSLKQQQNSAGQYAADSGAADAYVITLTPAVTAYAAGQEFKFKASNTNTTTSTINVNGLGAKTIKKKDGATDLTAGDIQSGAIYTIVYDGTNFQLMDETNRGKHTITIPAASMLAATTNGPSTSQVETTTNAVNFITLDFDASTDQYAHFNIAMPKSWNEETVTFQPIWTTEATDTDGVAWGLQAVALGDNEAADTAWGTAVVVTDDAQSAANEILIGAESGAVTIAGTPSEGDIVFFRVFRDVSDANDDMTEDARLISIRLFITTNQTTDN